MLGVNAYPASECNFSMAISEVNAVANLVVKGISITAQVQDGWYKGSVELNTLQSKLLVLRARHGQWNEQMQRYGISEDKFLLPLVEETDKVLEKFRRDVEKIQKSSFRRLQKKAFPGQLLYLVNKICEIVDAGPQVLVSRVANNDALDKYLAQTPAPLPFGPDSNCVPNVDSILAVRNALENSEGPRVVTVYGGPGTGKSSLMKYLGIHYQEEQKRLRADASFPQGVVYLFCGQHAGKRLNQLVIELLQNLGYGTRSVAVDDANPSKTRSQDWDDLALQTNKMQLRSRLAEQKLLIMVDDLWEANVLLELLVPAKGVKYLVTSQVRDIYSSAGKIQIAKPTLEECCQIMANFTDGLTEKGKFPDKIKSVAEDIVRMLQYHPLSLANVGTSINRSRATDIEHWDVIKKHLYVLLDKNESCSATAYDSPFSLSISASMMRMVETLPAEELQLLFVLALFKGPNLPESVVKYFYSFIQKDNFVVTYSNLERCLEDKSLIELTVGGDGSILNVPRLRTHYIRKRKSSELRSVSSQILYPSGHEGVATNAIKKGDAEDTLTTILSAIYYDDSFKDLVAGALEKHIRLINDGVIPWNLNIGEDVLDLVESARQKYSNVRDLVRLLNADYEVDNWKQQAHEYAKKIIIKFVCQEKLEDESMAHLLRLPQTTTAACRTLRALYHCHSEDFYERSVAFSEAYSETMQTLVDLFQKDAMSMNQQTCVLISLLAVLDYESKDYILAFATKYDKLLATNSEFILYAFRPTWRWSFARGINTMLEYEGLLKSFIAGLVNLGNSDLEERNESRRDILHVLLDFCRCRHLALKIAAFPQALKKLFHFFLSYNLPASNFRRDAGDALYYLSSVPENRIKVGAIEGIWNGLGGILSKLEEVWCATPKWEDRMNVAQLAGVAAAILGYLALEKDLRDTIVSFPGVKEGLIFLQLIEMARAYECNIDHSSFSLIVFKSTRALIILYSEEPEDPRAAYVPSMEEVLNLVVSRDEADPSMSSSIIAEKCYLSLYWTRVWAFMQMGSHAEALENLDVHLIPKMEMCDLSFDFLTLPLWDLIYPTCWFDGSPVLGDCRIFLQAMVEDYTGALLGANRRVQESNDTRLYLAERGVLKRLSGDLHGSLDDLDAAACMGSDWSIDKHEVLWQRGYVKWLMGDIAGARDDAEAAQGYRERSPKVSTLDELEMDIFRLHKIPVTYLGY